MVPTLGYLPPLPPFAAETEGNDDTEIVEVQLLLPRWQILALESVAAEHGLTTAQMLRRLIRNSIENPENALAFS